MANKVNPYCSLCGKLKTKENTSFRSGGLYFNSCCRECVAKKQREKIKDKEKIKQYNKLYREKNKEYYAEYDKKWKKNNPEKIKESRQKFYSNPINNKKYREQRHQYNNSYNGKEQRKSHYNYLYKNDHEYKLRRLLRGRVNNALKDQGGYKQDKTMALIGCTLAFLKTYLESMFLDGMSWKNHSLKGWHIDHIIPCASFDLTDPEQQKKCFHYTNLQPLWAVDNLRKGDRLDWSLEERSEA